MSSSKQSSIPKVKKCRPGQIRVGSRCFDPEDVPKRVRNEVMTCKEAMQKAFDKYPNNRKKAMKYYVKMTCQKAPYSASEYGSSSSRLSSRSSSSSSSVVISPTSGTLTLTTDDSGSTVSVSSDKLTITTSPSVSVSSGKTDQLTITTSSYPSVAGIQIRQSESGSASSLDKLSQEIANQTKQIENEAKRNTAKKDKEIAEIKKKIEDLQKLADQIKGVSEKFTERLSQIQ